MNATELIPLRSQRRGAAPAPEQCPDLVDAKRLAKHLGVTDKSVLRMAREGRIPSVKLSPRVIRFDVNEVDKALDRR